MNWIPAIERIPTREEFGAYPTVDVILECRKGLQADSRHDPLQRRHCHAVLRFFGGDPARHYWCDEKGAVLENDSWFVTHWQPIPEYPPCVQPKAPDHEH